MKKSDYQAEIDDLRKRVAYLSRRVTWLDERIKKLEGKPPKNYRSNDYDCNPQMYALQRENYFLQQGIRKTEIEKYLLNLNKTKSNDV